MKALKIFGVLIILVGIVIFGIGIYNYIDADAKVSNAKDKYGTIGQGIASYAVSDTVKEAKSTMVGGAITVGVGIFITILGYSSIFAPKAVYTQPIDHNTTIQQPPIINKPKEKKPLDISKLGNICFWVLLINLALYFMSAVTVGTFNYYIFGSSVIMVITIVYLYNSYKYNKTGTSTHNLSLIILTINAIFVSINLISIGLLLYGKEGYICFVYVPNHDSIGSVISFFSIGMILSTAIDICALKIEKYISKLLDIKLCAKLLSKVKMIYLKISSLLITGISLYSPMIIMVRNEKYWIWTDYDYTVSEISMVVFIIGIISSILVFGYSAALKDATKLKSE